MSEPPPEWHRTAEYLPGCSWCNQPMSRRETLTAKVTRLESELAKAAAELAAYNLGLTP